MLSKIDSLAMDKKWDMFILGRWITVKTLSDIHKAQRIEDKYIKKFGLKKFQKVCKKFKKAEARNG